MQKAKLNPVVLKLAKSVFSRSAVTGVSEAKTEPVKHFNKIPGPSSLPLLGPFHHYLPGGALNNLHGTPLCAYLYHKYGSIVRLDGAFGSPPTIFLFDPENVAHVLYSENWMPIRAGLDTLDYFRKKHNKPKQGSSTGLLTEHGEKWKSFRSTVNPVLMESKTIKLYEKVIDEIARDMITRMRSIRNEKNTITERFDVEMNKWALESMCAVALGERIGCLGVNLPPDSAAARLIQCVHDIFDVMYKLELEPSPWRLFPTPTFERAMTAYQNLVDLTRYFIQDAVRKLNERSYEVPEEKKGVLEKLLEINEDIAINMTSDMLFAGVDTAAHSLIATLYLLASNPEKQRELRQEIQSKDERRTYLKACIKESLRVLPIVFGNLRVSTKDYNLNGYLVPKGVNCFFPHEFISTQESQFDRANEFIPERWLRENPDRPKSHAHPLAYSPFGFGVRSCIGRRIAELELETFLARIIENFHVEWFGPPLKRKVKTITSTVAPYNFIFKDIKLS